MNGIVTRAGQHILILTIYIDIVNIINIDIEIGLKKILIFILSQGSISIYVHIGIDIE